ncbi:MAG: alpha/beta fold hydrolase [Rhodothermaceae bacterium]|nr:alpha/beta fold hydrolase [Rhodothermaceae bacterium]
MPASETVILLHGLGRTALSMRRLARTLEREGFDARNTNYASRSAPIEDLATSVVGTQVDAALREGAERVHFVTHSLGGILVRWFAEHHSVPEGSRAVMIAPPHGGSELADWARTTWPIPWYCGPALHELGTGPESTPQALGPVELETGVIAGDRSWHPLPSRFFDGTSDGTVPVERTKVDGMTDFLVVPRTHTLIMRAPEVVQQTLHFLRHGRFDQAANHAQS